MLEEVERNCPYCGSKVDLRVECGVEEQDYYEDCPRCCQPMLVHLVCTAEGDVELLELKTDRE
ncbi:CPXCG motif-containing cysteine-rich protein [Motiliproteus sp. SC1-56]|uniref:CPXCG motif-containing cysteine-rich protein n=1 Tax=Motiliproteus sp. SC1-56 TaxID=2799565 RepID=UPI001A903132|nr:CPXCG motif-containing cysteine-rich protein [Motiliproteus sp. SC1-56]